ncbi:MAG: recombination protein O N-terminal domain-containing protein [Candidatus Jorgensenbacteria bacterium]
MKDLVVHALVLGARDSGERDRLVRLFTKELGVFEARVVGGRRILSKFAPHLDVGNLAAVRLVKKNAYTVTDALTEERFAKLRGNPKEFARALALLTLLSRLLPREVPDLRLWHSVVRSFSVARVDVGAVLKLLGYDPLHAACEACGRKPPACFVPSTQSFLCGSCRGKFGADGIVL